MTQYRELRHVKGLGYGVQSMTDEEVKRYHDAIDRAQREGCGIVLNVIGLKPGVPKKPLYHSDDLNLETMAHIGVEEMTLVIGQLFDDFPTVYHMFASWCASNYQTRSNPIN